MSTFAPWQQRAYAQMADAFSAGRLGHAQLICGPARLGKREVAVRMARRVLCEAASGDVACGACRSCRLFDAGTHPDYRFVSFIPNREGTKLRTEIVIDQMRELAAQLALTPQFGRAQVAVVDPADAINHAAANALLKTLEEPVPGRYLWLVSAHPMRLPATIRSRCQRIELRLPPADEAAAWLAAQGHAAADAAEALRAARGHPGLADDWLRTGGLSLRKAVSADLQRLWKGEAAPAEIAQQWAADEHADLRLRHAADLAVERAAGLTDPRHARSLAAWFDRANRSRDLLRTTVRADLVLVELLVAWRALRGGPEKRER
ncbi:MAG: DNA polymerase III subunit delta' [Pseudomonadota bacterium]